LALRIAQLTDEGNHTLSATNLSGTNTLALAVRLIPPGSAVGWGNNSFGQLNRLQTATNLISISCGCVAMLAVTDSGSILA
jgi:hypothetical protein